MSTKEVSYKVWIQGSDGTNYLVDRNWIAEWLTSSNLKERLGVFMLEVHDRNLKTKVEVLEAVLHDQIKAYAISKIYTLLRDSGQAVRVGQLPNKIGFGDYYTIVDIVLDELVRDKKVIKTGNGWVKLVKEK